MAKKLIDGLVENLYNSNPNLTPDPSELGLGQLAVNTSDTKPRLFIKKSNNTLATFIDEGAITEKIREGNAPFSAHIANRENPHDVTYQQVGALGANENAVSATKAKYLDVINITGLVGSTVLQAKNKLKEVINENANKGMFVINLESFGWDLINNWNNDGHTLNQSNTKVFVEATCTLNNYSFLKITCYVTKWFYTIVLSNGSWGSLTKLLYVGDTASNSDKLGNIAAANYYHTGNSNKADVNWTANKLTAKSGLFEDASATPLTIHRTDNDANVGIVIKGKSITKHLGTSNGELRFGDSADLSASGKTIWHSGNSNKVDVDWKAQNIYVNGKLFRNGWANNSQLISSIGTDTDKQIFLGNPTVKSTTIEISGYDNAFVKDSSGKIWNAGNSNKVDVDWVARSFKSDNYKSSNDVLLLNYDDSTKTINLGHISNVGSVTGLSLCTNGSKRVFINQNGQVGVGTDNPVKPFHVIGNSLFKGNSNSATIELSTSLNSGRIISNINESSSGQYSVSHEYYWKANIWRSGVKRGEGNEDLSYTISRNGSDLFTLDNSGNLGVGVSGSVKQKLHVSGNGLFNGNVVADGDVIAMSSTSDVIISSSGASYLYELGDVTLTEPKKNDFLVYNGAQENPRWVNMSSTDLKLVTTDNTGKIPSSLLPDSYLGSVHYEGTWNSSTNQPDLTAVKPKGTYYVVTGSGSHFGKTWNEGDWIISNGTSWDKVDNTDSVQSVNGKTGAVTVTKEDVGLGNVRNIAQLGQNETAADSSKLGGVPAANYWNNSNFNPNSKMNVSGGTFTGSVNFANGVWNNLGDDAAMGDYNQSGCVAIKDLKGANPRFAFYNNSNQFLGYLGYYRGEFAIDDYTILHARNVDQYAPTKTGGGASGNWGINITGNAATASKIAKTVMVYANSPYSFISDGQAISFTADGAGYTQSNTSGGLLFGSSNTACYLTVRSGTTNSEMYVRSWYSNSFSSWYKLLHSGNFNEYAPSKTGAGASGNWGISITGNAATATTASTANAVPWSGVTSKPTTLAGYGITDAPTKTGAGATGSWNISISGTAANAAMAVKATQSKYIETISMDGYVGRKVSEAKAKMIEIINQNSNRGAFIINLHSCGESLVNNWSNDNFVLTSGNTYCNAFVTNATNKYAFLQITTYDSKKHWEVALVNGSWGSMLQNMYIGDTASSANSANSVPWSGVTGKPNTLSGYGITDAPTKTGAGASGLWQISISGLAANASQLGGIVAANYWHKGNFNPNTKANTDGSNASGNWRINITGSAGSVAWTNVSGKPSTFAPSAHEHHYIVAMDKRDILPNGTGIATIRAIKPYFVSMSTIGQSSYGTYADFLVLDTYSDGSGGNVSGIAFAKNSSSEEAFIVRGAWNGTSWTSKRIWHNGNFDPNSKVGKDGAGASGTWAINITGSAGSANTANSVPWSGVSGKPNTLAGYGITDAPTKAGAGASGLWQISISGLAANASQLGGIVAANYWHKGNLNSSTIPFRCSELEANSQVVSRKLIINGNGHIESELEVASKLKASTIEAFSGNMINFRSPISMWNPVTIKHGATIDDGVTVTGGLLTDSFTIKGRDNSYVVLAGGGVKPLSEFGGGGGSNSLINFNGTDMSIRFKTGKITTIQKSDTGIYRVNHTIGSERYIPYVATHGIIAPNYLLTIGELTANYITINVRNKDSMNFIDAHNVIVSLLE